MSYQTIRQFLLFMQDQPDECPAGDGQATTKVGELKDGLLHGRDCIGGFGGCCGRYVDLESLAEELRELSGFPMKDHEHRWSSKRGGGYKAPGIGRLTFELFANIILRIKIVDEAVRKVLT